MQVDQLTSRPNVGKADAKPFPWIERVMAKPEKGKKPEATPIENLLQAQMKNPAQVALERQRNIPEIQEATRKTCTSTLLEQYTSLKEIMDPTSGTIDVNLLPNNSWEREFLNHFETLFQIKNPGKNPRDATEKELNDFIGELVKEDKYQLWAIKIAEMQLMALQAATHADINTTSEAEERKDVSVLRAVNQEASQANATNITGRKVNDGRPGLFRDISTIKPHTGWFLGLKRIWTQEQLAKEGQKRMNTFYKVDFPDEVRLYIQGGMIAEPDPNNPNNTVLRPLDPVLQRYLRRVPGLENLPEGQPIDPTVIEIIRSRIDAITAARVNFYARHQRQLRTEDDLNMLDIRTGQAFARFRGNAAQHPSLVLSAFGLETPQGQGTVRVDHGGSLDVMETQVSTIMTGIQAEVEKQLKNNDIAATKKIITDKIQILEQQTTVQPDTEGIRKKQEEIDTEERRKAIREDLDNKIKEKTDTDAEIARLEAIVRPGGNLDQNLLALHTAEQTLADRTKEKNDLEEDKRIRQDLVAQVAGSGGKQIPQNLSAQVTQFMQDIAGLQQQIRQKDTDVAQAQAAVDQARQNVADVLIEQENRLKQLRQQSLRLEQQINNIRASNPLLFKPAQQNQPPQEYTAAEIKDRLKQLNAEKTRLTSPDIAKLKQKDAYKELDTIISPENYNKMRSRAGVERSNRFVRDELARARQVYPELPPAYLRTLQIIWGNDVTENTQAGKDKFKKAVKLLPPSLFIDIIKSYQHDPQNPAAQLPEIMSIVDIYDADHITDQANEAMLNLIDGRFIGSTMDRFLDQAKSGQLGALTPEDVRKLQLMETTQEENIDTIKTQLTTEVNTRKPTTNEAIFVSRAIDLANTMGINLTAQDVVALRQYIEQYRAQNPNATDNDIIQHISNQNTIIPIPSNANFHFPFAGGAGEFLGVISYSTNYANRVEETIHRAVDQGRELSRDYNEAVVLAGILTLVPESRIDTVTQMVYANRSLADILTALPGPIRIRCNTMITSMSQFIQNNPNASVNDLIDHMVGQIRTARYGLNPLTPEQDAEFSNTANYMKAIMDRESFNIEIAELNRRIPYYEDTNDLALQIVKLYNANDTYFPIAKMYAKAVDALRKKQT